MVEGLNGPCVNEVQLEESVIMNMIFFFYCFISYLFGGG